MTLKTSPLAAYEPPDKLSKDTQKQLAHMIKAAALEDDKKGQAYIKDQAALIFEQNHESIAASELRLKEAQQALKKIDVEIEQLERDLKKTPDTISHKVNSTEGKADA